MLIGWVVRSYKYVNLVILSYIWRRVYLLGDNSIDNGYLNNVFQRFKGLHWLIETFFLIVGIYFLISAEKQSQISLLISISSVPTTRDFMIKFQKTFFFSLQFIFLFFFFFSSFFEESQTKDRILYVGCSRPGLLFKTSSSAQSNFFLWILKIIHLFRWMKRIITLWNSDFPNRNRSGYVLSSRRTRCARFIGNLSESASACS